MQVPLFVSSTASAIALVLVASTNAIAQSLVCWPIATGDTASSLARRLTGDPTAHHRAAFQIRDPARNVFVPKSRYQQLSTGWQVCVAREILVNVAALDAAVPVSAPVAAAPAAVLQPVVEPPTVAPAASTALETAPPIAPRGATFQPPSRLAARYDLAAAVQVGVVVALVLFAASVVVRFVPPRPPPPDLQRAGEAFVSAFAHPLIDPGSSGAPLLVRLRFVRRLEQLEILLAPNAGRRYPNLQDHKRNVEYDIHRVLQMLGSQVAVSNPVRAEGKWVVIPIRLLDPKAGAS